MTATRTRARRWSAGVAAVGTAVVLLSSCGSDSSTTAASSSSAMGSAAAAGGFDAAAPATSAASSSASSAAVAGGEAAAGAPASIPALDNRQVIRTADLQVRLTVPADTPDDRLDATFRDALDGAVGNVRAQALAAGGFVADLQQSGGSASLVVRVPAATYDTFRDGAAGVGEVTGSTENSQDVTEEFTDVESRITSMKTSVDRIRTLLSQATAVTDIITIEGELQRREADLESLEGRRQVLADQVSLGTVSMTLTAVRAAPDEVVTTATEDDRSGFLGGLASGWHGLTAFLGGVGTVLGAVLPFVPLVAVLVLVGWWVRRTVRRHRGRPAAAPRVDGPAPA